MTKLKRFVIGVNDRVGSGKGFTFGVRDKAARRRGGVDDRFWETCRNGV